ncbi:MAG: hypothetical protein HY361_04535, partial [Candidatus Aenigmarchaeota archaeon]|nr:hypothetical protein [Candidatus Aenigmarchaeota archaeon]
GAVSTFGSLNATYINATEIRVGSNIVQVEKDSLKLSNYSAEYASTGFKRANITDFFGDSGFNASVLRISNYSNLFAPAWNFANNETYVLDNATIIRTGNLSLIFLERNSSLWNRTNANTYLRFISDNVGIGTTTPSDKLHVVGVARIVVNDTNNISTTNVLTLEHFTQTPLNSTGGIGVGILLMAIDNGSNVDDVALINATLVNALNGSEASSLGFYTRTSGGTLAPRLFINGSNVGINTTSPNQALTVVGNANITGFVNITGDLDVRGSSITLGDASTDTLNVNAYIGTHFIPIDNVRDLGSAANRWRTAYVDALNANNLTAGNVTISGTTSDTFTIFTNNSGNDAQDISLAFERGTPVTNAVLKWDSTNKRFDMNFPLNIQSENNLTVDTNTLFVDGSVNRVGIGTTTPGTALHVIGALNVSSDAYVGGNVGIGTTNPGSKLDVQGSVNVSGNIGLYDGGATRNLTFLWNPATGNEQVGITFARDNSANVFARILAPFYTGGGGLAFFTGNTAASAERVRIDNSGNVGIGTTNPGELLHLSSASPEQRFNDTDNPNWWDIGAVGDDFKIALNDSTSDVLYIDQDGNVGIGTTKPSKRLTIFGTGTDGILINDTDPRLDIDRSSTAGNSLIRFLNISGLKYQFGIGGNNDDLVFQRGATGTDTVVFTSEGNVGIGTTSPSEKLTVIGNANISGYLNISGDLVVNNKFNVSASTGNVNVAGTLDAASLKVLGNIVQVEKDSFKLSNYSAEYASTGFKLSNYSAEYASTGFKRINLTDFFG